MLAFNVQLMYNAIDVYLPKTEAENRKPELEPDCRLILSIRTPRRPRLYIPPNHHGTLSKACTTLAPHAPPQTIHHASNTTLGYEPRDPSRMAVRIDTRPAHLLVFKR